MIDNDPLSILRRFALTLDVDPNDLPAVELALLNALNERSNLKNRLATIEQLPQREASAHAALVASIVPKGRNNDLLVDEVGGDEPSVILRGSREAVREAGTLLFRRVKLIPVEE